MSSHGLTTANRAPRVGLQSQSLSWTDDLPVCRLSGVGFSTNQIYREDGGRLEEHEFEDHCFHFRAEDDVYLYGVFDGHDGGRVSHFASQRMPAELLLGQLNNETDDGVIKRILQQAFNSVEKGFFQSIDEALAEKTNLKLMIPEGISDYEFCQKYPEAVTKLQHLETEISGGTTAIVTLIVNNKLYVANVGDSRALLVKAGQEGHFIVQQLSVDHNIDNEDELLRLSQLGLDTEKIRQEGRKLGSHETTRSIGDYSVKGGYKDFDILSVAHSEPVIGDPEIIGGLPIDESCRFLLLFTNGLYKSLEEATDAKNVNYDIANMVATEFAVQSTLNGVAQAIVDKVVRLHHDTYMSDYENSKNCQRRDDITLIVRNFNMPLGMQSPTQGGQYNPVAVPYTTGGTLTSLVIPMPNMQSSTPLNSSKSHTSLDMQPLHIETNISSPESTTPTRGVLPWGTNATPPTPLDESSPHRSRSNTQTSSSDTQNSDDGERFLFQRLQPPQTGTNQPDEDGRIDAYVDFTDFYRLYNAARENAGSKIQ
ncbi:TGF-beta-activated kinase 1 and MAP3K7-binding protein 1-like [Saccoglossus kowalevskii]|uniref:TGF-beta-activated kinase 1 and MAP3K7-binding protein 1-like n=1 Tax=Saccoglossus kowalevskii TaxID=10224 RepID=A0ABM0GQL6_SACKO|nr:PREDICTED: TGF-beta-activated kinase 1 and MAP3K7-binding protein 1-like [Saccoglossus kowalevskii]